MAMWGLKQAGGRGVKGASPAGQVINCTKSGGGSDIYPSTHTFAWPELSAFAPPTIAPGAEIPGSQVTFSDPFTHPPPPPDKGGVLSHIATLIGVGHVLSESPGPQ